MPKIPYVYQEQKIKNKHIMKTHLKYELKIECRRKNLLETQDGDKM